MNKPTGMAQEAPTLDVCTDMDNCRRCKAHPNHRQGLDHAGISRAALRSQGAEGAQVGAAPSGEPTGTSQEAGMLESVARAIYQQWEYMDRWVEWVPGGNSNMQDKARAIARAALRSQGEPTGTAPPSAAAYVPGIGFLTDDGEAAPADCATRCSCESEDKCERKVTAHRKTVMFGGDLPTGTAPPEFAECYVCGRLMDGHSESDCHCFHRREYWEPTGTAPKAPELTDEQITAGVRALLVAEQDEGCSKEEALAAFRRAALRSEGGAS